MDLRLFCRFQHLPSSALGVFGIFGMNVHYCAVILINTVGGEWLAGSGKRRTGFYDGLKMRKFDSFECC